MIAIIDYGLGNLRSVAGALKKIGADFRVTHDKEELERADKFILPGVGAFGDGMANLVDLGLTDMLTDLVVRKTRPILGICLGSQLMARESFEFGHHRGLGWIEASVVRMDSAEGLRVPHVGWNDLFQTKKDPVFDNIPPDALFYYVHSYHTKCEAPELVIGECDYGVRFTAAFRKGNIYGTQFHPEKSQLFGLELLKNFVNRA